MPISALSLVYVLNRSVITWNFSISLYFAKFDASSVQARAVVTDKREAILRAAVKVFAQKGFFNSKVADIAKEAGIADGTVYLYFKSKDEILHSVFDRAMEEFISEGKREIDGIAEPDKKLQKIRASALETIERRPRFGVVFQVELRGSTKVWKNFRAAACRISRYNRQTIAEGQRQGRFSQRFKTDCLRQIFTARSTNGYELDFIEKSIRSRDGNEV